MDLKINMAVDQKLEALRRANVVFSLMPQAAASLEIDGARQRLMTPHMPPTHVLDTSNEGPATVTRWLHQLPLRDAIGVFVLWPHYTAGIEMNYRDFNDHYDDLWFPSADDVWVIDKGKSWLLQLDHEEMFSLFEYRPTTGMFP